MREVLLMLLAHALDVKTPLCTAIKDTRYDQYLVSVLRYIGVLAGIGIGIEDPVLQVLILVLALKIPFFRYWYWY